jgi:hypothetical protein
LLVLDEKRQSLAKTGVNDILALFGMKSSGDTPRIVNTGAIARAGVSRVVGSRATRNPAAALS